MKTSRSARRIAVATAGLLFVSLLGACSSPSAETREGELTPLTMRLHFAPDGAMSTLFAAQALGYFEEEGIALEIGAGKGSQSAVNEVAQGQSDFATAGAVNIMIGAGQGQNVESVAMWTGRSTYGFLIPEDSDIQDVEDFAGRTIVVGSGTPFAALLPSVLETNGVDPADVNIVNVDASALVQTYASGTGDALATAIPFAQPLVETNRPSRSMPWDELGFTIPDYSFVTNKDLAEENPELVSGFVRAMLRGVVAAVQDPSIGLDAMREQFPEVNYDAAATQLASYLPYYCGDNEGMYGTHDAAQWTDSVAALTKAGVLPAGVDADSIFTDDFLPSDAELACPISTE